MTEWKWNGARWWKFDFHTHTPASDDYGKGPDQTAHKARTQKEWLLDYMRAGIDCVAITDHNTGAWIDRLKGALADLAIEKPEGFRELCLFPGMEISVHGGIHVLAIFDSSKTTSDIDALRGAVQYDGTPGQSNGVTRRSFVEVVNAIVSAGGIAIPAHVDEDNGLFKQTRTTFQQVLDCGDIFAMELVNSAFQKPQSYVAKNPNWSEVLGSDGHHPSGNPGQKYPGSRFTWVKMGTPSIEGLQLALLDGSLSVRRSDEEVGNPNEHAPLVMEVVEISKARYIGREQPFTLNLNPWLNTIIGGRGTGKSTLVEFLRLALRRDDELPDDLKLEFEKYGRVSPSREDGGLLTNETKIVVTYRKNGSRFRIQWSPAGDLDPIHEKVDGNWERAEGDVRQRFPVRMYSQKQIFQLAKAPLALLRVVDDAPEVDYRSWTERWKQEEGRFLSLLAKAREIEAGLSEEPRLRGELDDVKRKLAIFEQAGHADVLKAFQRRRRQQQAVEAWEKGWDGAGGRLRQVATDIVPDILEESTFNPDSSEDTQLRERASKARSRLDEIQRTLEGLASQADEVLTEWRKNRDDSLWKRCVDGAVQAYQELREKLAVEQAGDPAAYGEFVQRRQTIEQRLKELVERKRQVDELKKQADASLQRLLSFRRDLTEARRTFLDNVLRDNRYVRIQVVPYGARESVEAEFRNLLQRVDGGFEKDIGSPSGEGLLGELYKDASSPQAIEQALERLKRKMRDMALNRHDPATLGDQRFAKHVGKLQPETLDRLDLWFPEDSLDVQYSNTGDGQRFRSIQEGSPGQKTASLLAFLLSYGEEPLILDQPEDDLDNLLIYGLIVTQLREVKQHRQVIVVTHNANIVVNGDAELVVALAARGGQTQIEASGSLQEKNVRDTICSVMEGGRTAFEQRYRRIALEGRHV
jgi:hypothetical protein